MESLQTLVRNLAIIILMANFLEMLLPSKSMQGFVKLIMGLFVISAVLGPVTSLLHLPLNLSVPAWTEVNSHDMPVLAGNNGLQAGKDAVQEQFKLILKNQIEALVLGVKGVEKTDVEIQFEESAGGLMDQPKVERVSIHVNSTQTEIKSVEPITLGKFGGQSQSEADDKSQSDSKSQPQSQSQSERTQTIQERVSALLQIPKDRISVTEN
ncbi:stage III sporulation protein AF [Desulfitobacterium sp. Sab5]|uniref:stage III sporulation protein AF n=1 Tax=Desulfitobacterium nosdiversum TaxID=3375356 RepID=UPI003CF3AAF7